jgi:outer membrane protein assembly factor BamE (lipoprotein component of BamABCDE complex)
MTKDQVAMIIGYPLTQYLFNQNRWDFMYQEYKNNKLQKSYIVTLYFDKNIKVNNIVSAGKIFQI